MSHPAQTRTRSFKQALFSADTEVEKNSRVMDSPFRAVQALDHRFDKLPSTLTNTLTDTLTKLIQTEISQCEQRIVTEVNKNIAETELKLLNEISVSVASLKSEFQFITERVNSLESKCSEISELREEITEVNDRVTKLETAMSENIELKQEIRKLKIQSIKHSNSAAACDLRINGIPYNTDEDLHHLFDNICKILQIPTPMFQFIHRLQVKNNKNKINSPDGVIIARLMTPFDKNFILKALNEFRKGNNLTLNLLGFETDTPNQYFYINENLTNGNFKILREAVTLRKKKVLHSAYSFRGLVYVKRLSTDQPLCIEDLEVLDNLLRSDNIFRFNNDYNNVPIGRAETMPNNFST